MDDQADRTPEQTDPVEVFDLSPETRGGSPANWLVRGAFAVVAVALVAGGAVLARDWSSPDPAELTPLAIGSAGLGAMTTADASTMWGGYGYELATDLPDLGESAPVYQLVRPEMSDDDWTTLVGALGVSTDVLGYQPDGSVVVDDGAQRFEAYPQPGSWAVNVGPSMAASASDAADPSTGSVSPAEAEQIARSLLDGAGVLDGADWQVEVVEGMMAAVAVSCAGPDVGMEADCPAVDEVSIAGTPTVETWSVQFHRVVDGVVTSGLEWTVEVGGGGAVDHVYGTLADLEPLGDYPLRSTQAAYDELVAWVGVPGIGTMPDDGATGSAGVAVEPPVPGTAPPAPVDGEAEPPVAGTAIPGVEGVPDGPSTPAGDDLVRLRPEECASGIEPGWCVPDWCLDNLDHDGCAEPCTDQSVECASLAEALDLACSGDPSSGCIAPYPTNPDGSPVTTFPCPPAERCPPPPDGCLGTVTVPDVPSGGRAPLPAPACLDPGVVCPSIGEVPEATAEDPVITPAPTPGCPPPVDVGDDPSSVDPLPGPAFEMITVTGVERIATVTWGSEDGAAVAYLVPGYRFVGTYPDGSDWWTEVVAVADDLVVPAGPIEAPVAPPVDEVPVTIVPDLTAPSTTDLPPCSTDHPEACVGSIPTTSAPPPPDTMVCVEVTTPNGVPVGADPGCGSGAEPDGVDVPAVTVPVVD